MFVDIRLGSLKYQVVVSDRLASILEGPVRIDDPLWRGINVSDDGVPLTWVEDDGPGILTTDLLVPTLEHWTSAACEDLFPSWKRFKRAFGPLASEIEENTLRWGEINRVPVSEQALACLSKLIFLQSGGASIGALRSFANQEEGYSWLFAPAQTSYLSPFAAEMRRERGAFGEMRLAYGEWLLSPLPNHRIGHAAKRAVSHGIPCMIEQMGDYAVRQGNISGGLVSAPFAAGAEGDKAVKRLKLLLANSATPDQPITSPLSFDGIPTVSGVALSNVLVYKGEGGALGGPGDGGCLVRKDFAVQVSETRTIVSQLPVGQGVHNPGTVRAGESLVGVEGLLPADHDCKVLSFESYDDGGVQSLKIKIEIPVNSHSPKFRGLGVKASAHPDLAGVLPIRSNIGDVDMILDAKSADLVIKQAFLMDTGRQFNVSAAAPDFDLSMSKAYLDWVKAHTTTVTVKWPVTPEIADIMRAVGGVVENGLAIRDITGVLCPHIVVDVEAPVTELRVTNSALTMLAALEIETQLGGQFQPVDIGVQPIPTKILTTEHTLEALKLDYRSALEFLASLYPEGFLIRNGTANDGVENVSVAVDPAAVLSFSSGTIQADDAMGLFLWRSLHEKANFANIMQTQASSVEKAQARELLGSTLMGLMASINNLAVSRAILRRLSTGKRECKMLTARTYDYIHTQEVWMSAGTAAKCGFNHNATVIVGRHPTALFFMARVKIKDLPYGVIGISSMSMNISNKGDADGDQLWVVRASRAPLLYSASNRKTVSGLISMMAWNSGLEITPSAPATFEAYKPKGANIKTLWQRSMDNYTRHSGIEETQFARTLKPVNLEFKNNGFETWVDPSIFGPMGEFGSIGVGISYGLLHNAYVLYEYTGEERFRAAFAIGQDIYEDVFLAGYTPDRYRVFDILKNAVKFQDIGKTADAFKRALLGVGITTSWEGVSEADVITALVIARNINAAFTNPYTWVDKYSYLVPVCKALRGLSSGNKDLIVTPDEWAVVYHHTKDDNPFREIVRSVSKIYYVLSMVHWSRQ